MNVPKRWRIVASLILAVLLVGGRPVAAGENGLIVRVSAAGAATGAPAADRPLASLAAALTAQTRPGTTIVVDAAGGPLVEDVAVQNVRGEPGKPITIRSMGPARATLRGALRLTGVAHLVVENLAIELPPESQPTGPAVQIAGEACQIRDLSISGGTSDGLLLAGRDLVVRGGQIAGAAGWGVLIDGEARVEGLRVTSCRRGGLRAGGDVLVANCLVLHNGGPAVSAAPQAALRCYHNLFYDNSGGLLLSDCRTARVLNNIFVNNFATQLLSPQDVELIVRDGAAADYNVYFRHPGKDQLLRGLPYAQGVDLSPLPAESPFGLRSGAPPARIGARTEAHSQILDILQRLTGPNEYTRSYEDLFVDLQQEDFRPRFTSPAVGRGVDLTAEVSTDVAGQPRSARHPDIGPFAAPAEWWQDLDAGRATIVDGTVPLTADGHDAGLGTAERPYSTLAKAAAFARWGSRIYVKDAIYRHTAMQTTFSLGPDSRLSGFPGHRPAFSPSEYVATNRWERVGAQGLFRIRDWHTFLGYNCRHNAWMQDFYGNSRIGGPGENVTSLRRNTVRQADPFRPIRFLTLDRDTPQVLADGVALQQAGGVLGLEDFSIGTMSAWGRDVSHLRPGSFMVGRRDFLLSRAVGQPPWQDGQVIPAGLNRQPEMNYRIRGHATGYVSEFVAWPQGQAWRAVHTYTGGERLWRLAPALTATFGQKERRTLRDDWRQVAADGTSAWWVRQFALPAWELKQPDGAVLARKAGGLARSQLPVGGWLQRQYQTGDSALVAVFDNPYQDYLEVRLPKGSDPNQQGLEVACFSGRVEAVWRKAVDGSYTPGVNAPGLAMLSVFRTMEVGETPEATAATASQPWQFGFFVPLGETEPACCMRMPAAVDPNTEDPWKFTVVDDCLYVFLPGGESPAKHSIEVACNSTSCIPNVAGSNSSFADWQDAGRLRPDWPAVHVYRTELDFGRGTLDSLWVNGTPQAPSPGFTLDPADATGCTLRLADEVRLGDVVAPAERTDGPELPESALAAVPERWLIFRYFEGDPATTAPREHRVSSKTLGPDRRVVLPSKPTAFPPRYAFFLAPADQPEQRAEQSPWLTLREASSREAMAQGTWFCAAAEHALYVCLFPGSEPIVSRWGGGRSDPMNAVRGLYVLGGNAYGHQKQYGWGAGLGVAAELFDDVSVGFSPGHTLNTVPGSVVRDCTFRWAGADVGRGGEVSGDERHTADRIGRPELVVDHCTFDVSNSFLFDLNDNPTKNIPFANHHLWQNNYFLSGMCGTQGPWWDQYCFNNVVQNCVFAGRGGVDVEVSENLIVRNNLCLTDKGMLVTFRGSDRGYAFNNTTFRGGGIWFHSEPERANATEQGQPCYGPNFPVVRRGPVPWLTIEPIRHERGINLDVRWQPLADQPEVYYCENWDQPSPLLIDAQGFAGYRGVGGLNELARKTYFHDPAARRLYVRLADGSAPRSASVAAPHIPQTEAVRRDLVYTLTVIRPGRLSVPHRRLSPTEVEVTEPVPAGRTVVVRYQDASGPRVERFPITAELATQGLPRLRLSGTPVDSQLFVGLDDQLPPRVRVTGSWTDVRPFEADLAPGGTILASSLMGVQFQVLPGHFPQLNAGDQFESVFHSRSVYHLASLNNVFLDMRSSVAGDAMSNMHHGANYLLYSEQTEPSHSKIDYNCYWKDLHAVPGPLSAHIQWGKTLVWNSTADKEGITLDEFRRLTGYEQHGLTPPSYFTLVANPLRFDFRPLPDSPLLGAGTPITQQVGTFLFEPDATNGQQRFTYAGNARDRFGQTRSVRPTLGAIEHPLRGARAYYVAPTGQDAPERGSRAAPFASPAYGLARMRPGDLLVLLPGSYRQPLVVNRSGTAHDFLHIVAENPPYPTPAKFPTSGPTVLDAAEFGDVAAVLLDGCAHVRIAGLRVAGSRAPAAIELRDTRDCVLEYVFVEGSDHTGIRATGRGNTLYECQVAGGATGYELAGSLVDMRWCAALGTEAGMRTCGPVAGLLLLQNRHHGGRDNSFTIQSPASDVVLDGNWADCRAWGYAVSGSRILLVNNVAHQVQGGIAIGEGDDFRVFNNSLLRCAQDGIRVATSARSVLVLNNLVQADQCQISLPEAGPRDGVWLDYNVYSRAQRPLQFQAQLAGDRPAGLEPWQSRTGWDRNSRTAPLVYSLFQEANGRWRIREHAFSVSNLTPHFNVGPQGANAWPYAGGGTFILDLPEHWKPAGDPARRVWIFDTQPSEGALAAQAHWYAARVDYRRADGTRGQQDLSRVDLPPDQIPAGSFCQTEDSARIHVRLPSDAQEPCPIGVHRKLVPKQAIGYYVGRQAAGAAEKYQGKLITEALAASMAQDGVQEVDAVANVLTACLGTPTLERGCPIQGLARDADGMPRPSVPGSMGAFGAWGGPGRFDIGAAEHGYFVP